MVTWLYSNRSDDAQRYYDYVRDRDHYKDRLDGADGVDPGRGPCLVTAQDGLSDPVWS